MAPAFQARMTPVTGPRVSRDPLGTPASGAPSTARGDRGSEGVMCPGPPTQVPLTPHPTGAPVSRGGPGSEGDRHAWLLCISGAGELRGTGGDAATHPAVGPAGVGLSVTLRARHPLMASQQQGEWNPKWGPLSLLINFPHPSTLRVIHLLFGWDSAAGRR